MTSTELIAQADRRYEEMRGESRGWAQGSWCSGYINGWMDHHADSDLLALLREAGEALDNYGEHRMGCEKFHRSDRAVCGCGLDAVLARIDAKLKEAGE